ncbi:HutD family protein [Streptomyces sp. NPDC058657]|uniref:HutD/Ves family protein n=1 Tax=unclassified Streptomyces TaxID=2593676 RepID=UPI00365E5792
MRLLRAADRAVVPWKNGGGVTREIAGGPPGSDAAGFDWRVSLADVAADGPFSEFPGVDRILTMVEGGGMALTLEGGGAPGGGGAPSGEGPLLVDAPCVPQRFPGDVATHCALLAGPVVNLNVMYRRGGGTSAEVVVAEGDVDLGPVAHGTLIAVVLGPSAVLRSPRPTSHGPRDLVLSRYDAAVCEGPGPGAGTGGTLRTAGRTALITVRKAG